MDRIGDSDVSRHRRGWTKVRVAALVIFLVFAAGAVIRREYGDAAILLSILAMSWLLGRRRPGRFLLPVGERWELYPRMKQLLAVSVLAVLMTAILAFSAATRRRGSGGVRLVGVVIPVAFVLFALAAFALVAWRRGAFLTVDGDGMRIGPGPRALVVPWRDVSDAGVRQRWGHRFLVVQVQDPLALRTKRGAPVPRWRLAMLRLNRKWLGGELGLAELAMGVRADEVAAEIRRRAEEARGTVTGT